MILVFMSHVFELTNQIAIQKMLHAYGIMKIGHHVYYVNWYTCLVMLCVQMGTVVDYNDAMARSHRAIHQVSWSGSTWSNMHLLPSGGGPASVHLYSLTWRCEEAVLRDAWSGAE